MLKRSTFGAVTAAAFLCAACGAPSNTALTASDSLMADVLVELHLLQARTSLGFGAPNVPKDSLLATYGLTQEDFDDRMEFYAEHPAVYSTVYNQVMDHLGREIHGIRGF